MTVSDILDFLNDNKIACTAKEGDYLFRRLDVNRDGRITYPEYYFLVNIFSFVKAILPKEDVRLR